MDSGAVTATLSKKLSNGYGVSGKSAYDGVFASPIKFRAHSLSSSFEDYCEIFGGSEASLGSSIPVLELPELNERKLLHDVRRSKLDYSKVFGGFGNLDTAVPYEELFAEPKKKDSFPEGASSPDKGENQCSEEDSTNCSKEIPLVAQEASTFNGAKRINLSYHKINQGSESRKNGTTHIAQLHAVPAYTCLIEEVNPLKIDGAEKSIPVVQHTYPGSHCEEGIKKSGHCSKSFNGPSPDSASTQSSNDRAKVPDRSDSIHLFFDACDISHGRVPTSQTVSGNLDNHHGHAVRSMPTKRQVCKSDASEGATGADSASTQSSNDQAKVPDRSDSIHLFFDACDISHGRVPTSQTVSGNLDNHHGHAVRSMPTKRQVYKSDASEGAAGSDSPLHLDEMVDSNSEAAASVAALRKAIEEAQERLKVAKDLMKRKKEGCPDRIKRRFNNDLKAGGKKEDKFAYKMMSHEETNMWQTFGEMDALPQISSMIEKPMMRVEQVTPDHRAEEMVFSDEAVREAQEKLDSTIAEHIEEEVEYKEADHKDATLEFKDSDNNKKVLYIIDDCQWNEKNAGKEAFEKPEESHQTMEVVEGTCVQESNEGKVNAGNEAGIELVDEKKLSCEELVDDIKLAQETFDYGAKDKKLKVEEEEETENRVTPLLEQEDCESKLGECGLMIGNDKKFNCKPEDEKNVEGHCQQEECLRNLRDYQGFVVLKKKITQEQREGEEKVEVFSHLEECELSEILDPIDNEKTFNPHDLDLVSMERQIENLGCVEDGKEADFLDLNQEIEHCCQREGTKNRFGNFCVPEILEGIVGHVHDEEGFHEIMTKDSDSEGFQDAQEKEMEFEGATNLMEENERGRKHNSESEEMINVTQNGPNYEEKKTKEAGRTMEREHCCQREGTKNRLGNICVPEILEGIVGHVHDEEGFREIMTKDSDSEGFQDAQEKEMELEGATNLMEENERGRKHNSESEEIMSVTQNGPNCEEKKIKESGRTTEISPNNEPDEGENLSKIRAADTNVESDETPEVTPEGYVHNEEDDILVASNASFQREEKYNDSESVQEMNDLGEKHSLKTSALTQGALEHNEVTNQMPYTNETVSFDSAATYIGDPDMKVEQNQDDCLKEAENNCNRAMLVEETSPEFQDIFKCVKDAEDALNAEIDESQSNFSDGEILVDNDHNIEASQPPIMSEWQSSSFNYQENKSSNSNPKEIHQATLTMEENKANDTSQKVELETEHLRKIDEAKEREREKEKEKIAVERAIREVRERAFAEARERASLERAAAEARRKNISDGRERLGKATGQANEKTPAERVAMEAKLKAERAAVERATAEARARALERALSEKAASEARNKPDKVFAEKSFGGSREIGMKPNFSKSFTYGETFDGANGDSAQRCKARSERHQRIGERVAQALAEKNARDRLVQKEQEDRNRVAETLDADVKRWSSGKEGNLRALLSTLQYILGPDSGWQPIHLTDIINATAVKKAYRKATLFVHPDKLQQRGASIQQKYTSEKVFDLLKEAWNRFNMEER